MVRLATIATIFACVLLAIVATGAGAHRFNAPTTAEISSGGADGASGTVSSPKAVCKRNRKVELFRVDETGAPAASYGVTRTDASGNWRILAPLVAGDYYVTVQRVRNATRNATASKRKKRRHRHKCQAGQSATVRL